MEMNMTKEEFVEYYNSHTYKQMELEKGWNPKFIAKVAKQLGLSKPIGRKEEEIRFN